MKPYFLLILCVFGVLNSAADDNYLWTSPLDGDVPAIEGRAWNAEIGNSFHRFPDRAKDVLRDPVWHLSKNSAGLSIRFVTDAPDFVVRYQVEEPVAAWNMTPITKSGIDMYVTDDLGVTNWCAAPAGAHFPFNTADTISYHFKNLVYHNKNGAGSEYELFLPLYNTVKWLEIGVPATHRIVYCRPSEEKPIVMYGTSIAQGASASRPALAWGAIVKRNLGVPFINLAFSGNALMDPAVYDMICEVDACLFILDCMENMYGVVNEIVDRTVDGVLKIRRHSNAPILLVENCGFGYAPTNEPIATEVRRTNEELKKAFDRLKALKVPNIHYMTLQEIGLSPESQTDGWHANDIGMSIYAKAYIKKINKILPQLSKRKWKYRLE